MRAYVRHATNTKIAKIEQALQDEQLFFESIGSISDVFTKRIETIRTKIVSIIDEINTAGLIIAVMGASTKGNTILQYFGLTDKDIDHAAEVNPDKYGKRTVGSNIPIISQEESLKRVVDYYFILPWGFIQNFVDRNMDFLKAGGKFLVPLPEPRILTADTRGVIWTQLL